MRSGSRVLAAAVMAALGCDLDLGVPGVPPAPGRDATRFLLPALHAEPAPVLGGRIVYQHGRE